MNSTKDIYPISYFKQNANAILEQIQATNGTMILTVNGRAAGVLISPEKYENYENEIALAKMIHMGRKRVEHNELKDAQDVFKDILTKYAG